MAVIKPFLAVRPREEVVAKVAALPYDVYNREEAKAEVEREPMSFLKVDRPETQFSDETGMYEDCVYEKARELLNTMIEDELLVTEETNSYYIYELIMEGRSQTGIVACASIDDYLTNVIKKHENTREEKEVDRIKHVDSCNAQTGPIFLAYRSKQEIDEIVTRIKKTKPLYHFIALDQVTHRVWTVSDSQAISDIEKAFKQMEQIYIADGHHRAASAVKVGLKRRQEANNYTGKEPFNYFLSVLFPDNQLKILDYNRVVSDLNGNTIEQLFEKIEQVFIVEEIGKEAYRPEKKGTFGMYLERIWYKLTIKECLLDTNDPVENLDISLLHRYFLEPILNIGDARIDKRIDFVGGIRGLKELEKRVNTDMKLAFSIYPTSITELFAVSDADRLMPPKSTWFEPKLRSGLFIHKLD